MLFRTLNIREIRSKSITWYGIAFFYNFFPNIIINKIKFIYLKKLLNMSHGHDYYIKNKQEDLFYKIIEDFEDIDLKIPENKFSSIVFGQNINNHTNIIKQIILKYILNQSSSKLNIIRSILLYNAKNKKLIYPINTKFEKIFNDNSIKINKFLCNIYWYLIILIFFFVGLKKIINIFLISFSKNKIQLANSIYFDNLPEEALNINKNLRNEENYFSFILNYYRDKKIKLENINHSLINSKKLSLDGLNIFYNKKYLINMNHYERFNFLLWSAKAILLSLFDIIRGRWWHALLLSEAVERHIVTKISNNNLHKTYLFSQSGGYIFRPLWTYEAEKKGSNIIFYFYSLNYFPLTSVLRRPPSIKLSSWSNYIVWNKRHEQNLRKFCNMNFNVFNVDPTFLIPGMKKFIPPKENFITIFDVTPQRISFQKSILIGSNIYKANNCIKFLKKIIEIGKKNKIKIILKSKRFHSVIDRSYLVFLRNEIEKKNLYLIDDQVSTISLIKRSRLIISYPITSINKIADIYQIKNYYFCPFNQKINNDLLQDSKIIYHQEELSKIIKNVF